MQNARTAIAAVDLTLFVVDGSVPAGRGDRYIAELLTTSSVPVVMGLNKLDQQIDANAAEIAQSYQQLANTGDWPILQFSALTGDGLEALQTVLIERLESGPYYYPPDLATDQPERFIMGELIREQILLLTREEVPHSVAIAIDRGRGRRNHYPNFSNGPC